MASKKLATTENKLAGMKINENLEKRFLHDLDLKFSLLFGNSITSCRIKNKGMTISLETFTLKAEIVRKLLEIVDNRIIQFFLNLVCRNKVGVQSIYLLVELLLTEMPKIHLNLKKFK